MFPLFGLAFSGNIVCMIIYIYIYVYTHMLYFCMTICLFMLRALSPLLLSLSILLVALLLSLSLALLLLYSLVVFIGITWYLVMLLHLLAHAARPPPTPQIVAFSLVVCASAYFWEQSFRIVPTPPHERAGDSRRTRRAWDGMGWQWGKRSWKHTHNHMMHNPKMCTQDPPLMPEPPHLHRH